MVDGRRPHRRPHTPAESRPHRRSCLPLVSFFWARQKARRGLFLLERGEPRQGIYRAGGVARASLSRGRTPPLPTAGPGRLPEVTDDDGPSASNRKVESLSFTRDISCHPPIDRQRTGTGSRFRPRLTLTPLDSSEFVLPFYLSTRHRSSSGRILSMERGLECRDLYGARLGPKRGE